MKEKLFFDDLGGAHCTLVDGVNVLTAEYHNGATISYIIFSIIFIKKVWQDLSQHFEKKMKFKLVFLPYDNQE